MVPPRPPARRQPRAARGLRRRCRCSRCSCSTRRSGARPGRAAARTSPPRCAALDGQLRQRRTAAQRGPRRPGTPGGAGREGGRRRAGARRRRLRPLRSPPRPGGRAGAGRRRHRAGPHRARRTPSRPAGSTNGSRRPLPGLHAVQRGLGRPRLARPGRPAHRRELARARRGHHRHPGAGAARRARRCPRPARPRPGGAGRSSSTRVDALRRGPRPARRRRHLAHVGPPQVGRDPPAHDAGRLARKRSAGAATYRKELGLARVLRRRAVPPAARRRASTSGRSSRGCGTTEPGAQLEAWQEGPHRLPDRRRRACASFARPAGCTTGSG